MSMAFAGRPLLISLLFLGGCTEPPPPPPSETLEVGLIQGEFRARSGDAPAVGKGYNRFTLRPMESPFKQQNPDESALPGQRTTFSISKANTYARLYHLTTGGGSIEGSGITDAGTEVGGEASTSYLHERESVVRSETVLVEMRVENGATSRKSFVLTDDAKKKMLEPQQFIKRYGTEFIETITTGGSFWFAREYTFRSDAERKQFDAEISAHYGPIKGEAEFHDLLIKLNNYEGHRIDEAAVGGSKLSPADMASEESIFAFVKRFAKSALPGKSGEQYLSYRTKAYSDLGFEDSRLRQAVADYKRLIETESDLKEAAAWYKVMADHPTLFCPSDFETGARRAQFTNDTLQTVTKWKNNVVVHTLTDAIPPIDTGPALPVPSIRPDLDSTDLTITWHESHGKCSSGTACQLATSETPAMDGSYKGWIGSGGGDIKQPDFRFATKSDALGIQYRLRYGQKWTRWKADGETSDPTERIDAIEFALTGPLKDRYLVRCEAELHDGGSTRKLQLGLKGSSGICGENVPTSTIGRLAVWVDAVPEKITDTCRQRDAKAAAVASK